MANDFSGDSDCVCLYTFEGDWTGGTLSDDKGSVDLTAYGGGTPAYPDQSADEKEGTYSADFEVNDDEYFGVVDSSLPAAFPGKTGYPDISICLWFKPETDADMCLAAKWCYSAGERSWAVWFESTGNKIAFWLGYNGGASYLATLEHDGALTVGQYYHIGIVYDDDGGGDSKGNVKIRIWDDTGSAILQSGASDTHSQDAGQQMSVDTGDFGVGSMFVADVTAEYANMDGLLDEVVIFTDLLTVAEIDEIRLGTYGAGGLSIPVAMHHYQFNLGR